MGPPEGQLNRLALLALTGLRGWGDQAEAHMSYAWLQMFTRAKEGQRKHLGVVGGVVEVDAEEGGGGRGTMPPPCGAPRAARQGARWAGPARPQTSLQIGGQPSGAKPLPATQAAAHVDAWVAAQAGAMPEWQKRAVAAEGEVLLLRGKLQEVEQRAGGGAAGKGGGAGPGPSPGGGPQTQAEGVAHWQQ